MSEELWRQVLDVFRRESIKHVGHSHDFCRGITETQARETGRVLTQSKENAASLLNGRKEYMYSFVN